MNVNIPHSLLKKYLQTKLSPEKIANCLSLCGPSIDYLEKIGSETVYQVEIITNRIDTASAFGLAREAAAILPQFNLNAKLINNPYESKPHNFKLETKRLPLNIQILDQSLIPRFTAIILSDLKVNSSPKDIQKQLLAANLRPINNLVDVTNYLTLSLGQPCHIFDYHKIKNHLLKIRTSKKGESVTTLDNRTHILRGGDIVIEDGSGRLIDLCGIMGGKLSEVDETTTTAILFIQTYNPNLIRKTSIYTQERTLAAQIFEKSPDSELVLPTLIEGVDMLKTYASAKISSQIFDIYPQKPKPKTINLQIKKINQVTGINFNANQISTILKPLGLNPKIIDQKLSVSVPSWRHHDLSIPEDIIEEISRIYGYFRFPNNLPPSITPQNQIDTILEKESELKTILTYLGYTEVYSFSLTSKKLFDKALLPIEHSIEIKNPLTNDFQFLRRSLIPQILDILSQNRGKVALPHKIFELSHIYLENNNNLPHEIPILTLASTDKNFYKIKGEIETFFDYLKTKNINFKPLSEKSELFNTTMTAEIYSKNSFLGIIGQISPTVQTNFQLQKPVILINLDVTTLIKNSFQHSKIIPPPTYPPIIENITIQTSRPIGEIINLIKKTPLVTCVKYLKSYHQKHTFEIHFNHQNKNLTQKEVEPLKAAILSIS